MTPSTRSAWITECFGTFTLILIGAGAGAIGLGGLLGVAFAHGMVVIGLAYSYGYLSGVHINPAVTLAHVAAGAMKIDKALGYWVAQLVGGTLGAFLLRYLLAGSAYAGGLGETLLAEGVGPMQGLILETVLTFFLASAVLHTALRGVAGEMAGIAIGFTLIACILMGAPLTGASLNPARTLGPAIAGGNFSDLWLYICGPMLGGAIAGLSFTHILREA